MTKRKLLAELRRTRSGWTNAFETMLRLQDADDKLIDGVWSSFSDADRRSWVRNLNAVWGRHKNNNLEYTFAVLNQAIAILEKRQ